MQAAARRGATVRWAEVDLATTELPAGEYGELLSERTRLVAVTAASNVVGTRPDLAAIAAAAHAVGALVYVDGVHATPHVPVDVTALGADFYATSAYKWSGPHIGTVVADPALLDSLHPDKLAPAPAGVPGRFERGTAAFADLAGVVAAVEHLASLGHGPDLVAATRRQRVLASMATVEEYETQQLFAGLESPAAHEALEKLCRTYWRPIYAFLRRQGLRPDEAEDITQGFFAQLLERKSFDAVRKEKGRLRSYLLGALKYFLADEQRRAMAIKRGKGQRIISLEDLRTGEGIEMEPADPMTAEMIYERRWALTVLERVLSRLKDEYRTAGNTALFDALKELLPDEPGSPSQAEIAARLGMTENAVRQAFYRFRQRYQSLLREEIAHTVATPGDIEDELRHLIAVLES